MGERYLPVLLYNPATEGVTPRRNDAVKGKNAAVLDELHLFRDNLYVF